MKRYIGNTGRIVYVEDAPVVSPQSGVVSGGASPLSNIFGGSSGLFGGGSGSGLSLPFGLEIADIAILLLFFFLYQESGDEEFLILLACFAICILGKQ